MNKWQRIETAPVDGTRVLVCAQFYGDRDEYLPVYIARYVENYWRDDCDKCVFFPDITHWMPLPESILMGDEEE